MGEAVEIRTGPSGGAQEGSFMNATLQNHGGDDGIAISIATYVKLPVEIGTPEAAARFLDGILNEAARAANAAYPAWNGSGYTTADRLKFEVEVGNENDDD